VTVGGGDRKKTTQRRHSEKKIGAGWSAFAEPRKNIEMQQARHSPGADFARIHDIGPRLRGCCLPRATELMEAIGATKYIVIKTKKNLGVSFGQLIMKWSLHGVNMGCSPTIKIKVGN